MNNLNQLTTPNDYIAYYYDQIKKDLGFNDVYLSKTGFIGYILSVLGNTQFDIKNYYDKLFLEAFPYHSLDNENLFFHSQCYGYDTYLAKASSLTGYIKLNLNAIPDPIASNLEKRIISIKNLTFSIDNIQYTIDADIDILIDADNVKKLFIVDRYIGKQVITTLNSDIIPLPSCLQHIKELEEFVSPNYLFGTFYPYEIILEDDEFVSSIIVKVNDLEFDAKVVKLYSSSQDTHIFYRMTSPSSFVIELGNGIVGKYIPNSKISVTYYRTKGKVGNIAVQDIYDINGDVLVDDRFKSNDIVSTPFMALTKDLLAVHVYEGTGGENVLSGDDLRRGLLKHIQTRTNLVSKTDYDNILSKYFKYYDCLIKRNTFMDYGIFIYIPFFDTYNSPLKTITKTITKENFEFNNQLTEYNNYYPELEMDTGFRRNRGYWPKLPVNPTVNDYYLIPQDFEYNSVTYEKNKYLLRTSTDWVSRDNKPQPSIDYNYKGQLLLLPADAEPGDFFELTCDLQIRINDDMVNVLKGQYIRRGSNNWSIVNSNLVNFVSPFLYVFDELLNFYKTYIVKELIIKNYNDVITKKPLEIRIPGSDYLEINSRIIAGFTKEDGSSEIVEAPFIFLQITYDAISGLPLVILKSHQDLSQFEFKIIIPGAINFPRNLTKINDNEFVFDEIIVVTEEIDTNTLTDDEKFIDNLIIKKELKVDKLVDFDVTILLYKTVSGQTPLFEYYFNNIQLSYDVTDLIKLKKMTINDTEYILNVPFIEKDKFELNKNNYIDKLITYFTSANISENRQVNDEIQVRFLNTFFATNVSKTIKQVEFTEDILLPLKLKLNLVLYRSELFDKNITWEIDNLKSIIAKFLLDYKTGIELSFYKSQITELCHDLKFIKSVVVNIYDNGNNILSDIETIDHYSLIDKLSKSEVMDYCTLLWWWDLNNIEIKYVIE